MMRHDTIGFTRQKLLLSLREMHTLWPRAPMLHSSLVPRWVRPLPVPSPLKGHNPIANEDR